MIFKFLVISKAGFLLFEYPMGTSEGSTPMTIDSVLLTGLLGEISSYSASRKDEMVDELKFGAVKSAFSRDEYNNLYLILSSEAVSLELLKQIHVEMKNLFMNSLTRIEVPIDPDRFEVGENIQGNRSEIESIFNPFYRMWLKKLQLSI